MRVTTKIAAGTGKRERNVYELSPECHILGEERERGWFMFAFRDALLLKIPFRHLYFFVHHSYRQFLWVITVWWCRQAAVLLIGYLHSGYLPALFWVLCSAADLQALCCTGAFTQRNSWVAHLPRRLIGGQCPFGAGEPSRVISDREVGQAAAGRSSSAKCQPWAFFPAASLWFLSQISQKEQRIYIIIFLR